MSTHFGCGAFIIGTTTFVLPDKAIKRTKYQCPRCGGPVIPRKGEINAHHFAHHGFSTCTRYSTNTACESPQHEEAKYNFRTELYEHREMDIYRTCRQCNCKVLVYQITSSMYNENTKGMCEHDCGFEYDKSWKIPDTALVESGKIIFICEVYHTHRTLETDRPSDIPWVEIEATWFNNYINTTSDAVLQIQCIRDSICNGCELKNKENFEREQARLLAKFIAEEEKREAKRIAEEQKREAKRLEAERREKERIEKELSEAKKKAEKLEKQRLEKERLEAELEKRRLDQIERSRRSAEEFERLRPEREAKAKQEAEERRVRNEKIQKERDEEAMLRYADKRHQAEILFKKTTRHGCGILLIDMCECEREGIVPEYEPDRITGKLFCKQCKKRKCRCTA